MANPTEICEVACRGQIFRDWTSVSVTRSFDATATEFRLTVAELSKGGGWGALKLRPGDEVSIVLAGHKVAKGLIYVRQAALTGTSHAVMLQGASLTMELVIASHVAKGGQYKGYTFEQIANAVVQPFGISFQWANMPDEASKPFRDPQTFIGETAFQLLERLARQRGVKLHDDENGNLVGDDVKADSGTQTAMLEEGKNIVAINAMVQDLMQYSKIGAIGQQKGDDDIWGKDASEVKAEAENPAVKRHRPLMFLAEEPSSKKDLQARVDREVEERNWTAVQVQVVVQGWLKPDGGLWRVLDRVSLKSPSTIPTSDGRINLFVRSVTFSQTADAPGTITTLELCLRVPSQTGGTDAGSPNVLDSETKPAEPVT